MTISTPILDSLAVPPAIARLSPEEQALLGEELRRVIIDTVSRNGGHLAASLGVVELTMALLSCFDPGRDKIIWDVGHQAYAYKLLTGRKESFHTLRRLDGICGFPCMAESGYDHFGVGHSSTSISAALGMAVARDLAGDDYNVLAVIGDGSMTAGLAYEGLNQAGDAGKRLIVVLNDNEMSISKNVGALSFFLSRKLAGPLFTRAQKEVKDILGAVPRIGQNLATLAQRGQHSLKGFLTPGMLFEAFRFNYIGPVDGHDMKALTMALNVARGLDSPALVHVLTTKGKGYAPAEANPVQFHGVGCFLPEEEAVPPAGCAKGTTDGQVPDQAPDRAPDRADDKPGKQAGGKTETPDARPGARPHKSEGESVASLSEKELLVSAPASYTSVFGKTLVKLAAADPRIVAITAAMPEGTGLTVFGEAFPERFVDVGICEQHAVTFAAGLAARGLKPFVAVYSTFLQRSYDQIVHDVCLQKLPVTFCIDRAGIVGEDGATHQGLYDIAFLRHIPNLRFMAPRNEAELARALVTALASDGPFALRYPRGSGTGAPLDDTLPPFTPGESEILREGDGSLAIIALGNMVDPALDAAELREKEGGPGVTVCNARWIKPLDRKTILALASAHQGLLILEEGCLDGGFGSAVLEVLAEAGLDRMPLVRRAGLPDSFIEHGPAGAIRARYGLDREGVLGRIRSFPAPLEKKVHFFAKYS